MAASAPQQRVFRFSSSNNAQLCVLKAFQAIVGELDQEASISISIESASSSTVDAEVLRQVRQELFGSRRHGVRVPPYFNAKEFDKSTVEVLELLGPVRRLNALRKTRRRLDDEGDAAAETDAVAVAADGNSVTMVILVGPPASGKSYFSSQVLKHAKADTFGRVNQDEMKSRKNCEVACRQILGQGKSVLVDRMNQNISQRSLWIKEAGDAGCTEIICVYLNIPLETCLRRIKVRKGHPTIKTAEEGLRLLPKLHLSIFPPSIEEGFTHVLSSTTEEESTALVQRLMDIVEDRSEQVR